MPTQAKEKREHYEDDLKTEYEKMRDDYFKRANARIEKIRIKENEDADQAIAALEKEQEASTKISNDTASKKMDEWVEQLFNRIIKVTEE